MQCQECEYHKQRAALWRHEAYRLCGTPLPWNPDEVIQNAESVKAYCHMGKLCIGCSPQLVEGICPDSQAGRLFTEMLEALEYAVSKYGKPGGPWNVPSDPGGWLERSRAVIAKVRGKNDRCRMVRWLR